MTKSNWRTIAELIGIISIVASLVFVGLELRQTQSALKAQAYQARAFEAINFAIEAANNPELGELVADFQSGKIDVNSVSSTDRRRLRRFYGAVRNDVDNEHYQFSNGYLDADYYRTTVEPDIKASAPLWRQFAVREPRQAFKDEVDRILSDPSIVSTRDQRNPN